MSGIRAVGHSSITATTFVLACVAASSAQAASVADQGKNGAESVGVVQSGQSHAPIDGQPTATGATSNDGGVEEIIVTAQRRQERLQDVPVAVQALTSSTLEDRGIERAFDLPNAVPGLAVNRAANVLVYFLRGVGNPSQVVGSDPSIASYIDGIYQAFPNGAMLALNNIERIEVLKGPQGTLFGRNATGGLVQIVTKTPSFTPTLELDVEYGRFDTFTASGYVSGGSGIVAADLAVTYSKQSEGWGRNLFTPDQAGEVTVNGVPIIVPDVSTHEAGLNKDIAIAGKILIEPSDDLSIKLAASHAQNTSDQGVYRNYLPGSKALMIQAGMTEPYTRQGGFWDWNSNTRSNTTNRQSQFSADITYEAKFATFRSITAYIDALSDPPIYSPAQPRVESPGIPQLARARAPVQAISQELQLVSSGDSSIDWLVGAYYQKNETGYKNLNFYRGNYLEGGIDRVADLETETTALFGQVTISLSPKTRLTGGARYTHDDLATSQYYIGTSTTVIPAPGPEYVLGVRSNIVDEQRAKFNNVSYRVALDHRFSDEVMVYASVNTGYKAGGFNTGSLCTTTVIGDCPQANIAPPVDPEKITAYEVGFKSDLLDRALRINASAFYYDYRDLQVISLVGTPIVALLQNAAKAKIKGFDVEVDFRPTRNLSFNGAIEVLSAKYSNFPNALAYTPRTGAPFGNSSFLLDNAKGNDLSRAPRFSAAGGVTWRMPLERGGIDANVNFSHNGGFYWEVTNRLRQKAYTLVNANLSYSFDDHYTVGVFAKNLTDTKYHTYVDAAAYGDRAAAGAPATYGIRLSAKY